MQLITVAGPPSSGKTSVLIKTLEALMADGIAAGVIKFDCLVADDDAVYRSAGVPVQKGLSGVLCPDHYFVSNIDRVLEWSGRRQLAMTVIESAGLCNRCSPHIKGSLAVCVLDNVSGLHTPKKIGPMLKLADVVVVTKGDIVSQAEREVFAFRVQSVAPRARIIRVNGRSGQGAHALAEMFKAAPALQGDLAALRLRFPMPAALCSYCLGETRVGPDYQIGQFRKLNID
ncbi:GTP-binding protein [Desulfobulbus elongatus]|uniref:GTP-binding protein n=1 Tax=Desulfobulbus elongatus TaxID=53332 RepID=UPI000487C7D3|nr:GTP-binding protein [Desulfobulbus elongatus]